MSGFASCQDKQRGAVSVAGLIDGTGGVTMQSVMTANESVHTCSVDFKSMLPHRFQSLTCHMCFKL